MRINMALIIKKVSIVLAIVAVAFFIILMLGFLSLPERYDEFDKIITRLDPLQTISILFMYYIFPSLIPILVLELKKIKQLRYYLFLSTVSFLFMYSGLLIWMNFVFPYFETLNPPSNNFSSITSNPAPVSTSRLGISVFSFVFLFGNIMFTYTYWYFAVRVKKEA